MGKATGDRQIEACDVCENAAVHRGSVSGRLGPCKRHEGDARTVQQQPLLHKPDKINAIIAVGWYGVVGCYPGARSTWRSQDYLYKVSCTFVCLNGAPMHPACQNMTLHALQT